MTSIRSCDVGRLHTVSSTKVEIVRRSDIEKGDVVLWMDRFMVVEKITNENGGQVILSLLTDTTHPYEETRFVFYYKARRGMYKLLDCSTLEPKGEIKFFVAEDD